MECEERSVADRHNNGERGERGREGKVGRREALERARESQRASAIGDDVRHHFHLRLWQELAGVVIAEPSLCHVASSLHHDSVGCVCHCACIKAHSHPHPRRAAHCNRNKSRGNRRIERESEIKNRLDRAGINCASLSTCSRGGGERVEES